ncbi:MAG: hypothetical protein ACKPKO_57680, partial [Candidatus Fonsibacter sp.]
MHGTQVAMEALVLLDAVAGQEARQMNVGVVEPSETVGSSGDFWSLSVLGPERVVCDGDEGYDSAVHNVLNTVELPLADGGNGVSAHLLSVEISF